MDLADRLKLAILIAQALAGLHAQGVVHKDVNPSNIVWNAESGGLKLIDLGISTPRLRELTVLAPVQGLEGTLRYIAPESLSAAGLWCVEALSVFGELP